MLATWKIATATRCTRSRIRFRITPVSGWNLVADLRNLVADSWCWIRKFFPMAYSTDVLINKNRRRFVRPIGPHLILGLIPHVFVSFLGHTWNHLIIPAAFCSMAPWKASCWLLVDQGSPRVAAWDVFYPHVWDVNSHDDLSMVYGI